MPHRRFARAAAAEDLARAGVSDAPIEIVGYDPSWPERFAAERERLSPLFARSAIHHIGSTAVPGLAAKPIIDLMVLVEDLDAPIPALVERGGYQLPEAFNATLNGRRWLCRPSPAYRTHHLHLVSDPRELERHLRFRDRLRAEPALAAEYADLKRGLADRHRDERETYSAAKAAFVRRVESAVEAYCSPSNPPTEPTSRPGR